MAWIAGAVAILGSVAKSQQDKAAAKKKKSDDTEMTAMGAYLNRLNSQFDAEQDYYYTQLDRQAKSRGLDEFRKFSTVKNFAPDYQNSNKGPVLPARPIAGEGMYKVPEVVEPKKKKWTFLNMLTKPSLDPGNLLGGNEG